MAKSARASSKKVNHTKLRARVFGPAEKARAERIHAKLLETINQPKPERTTMDVEETSTTEAKEDDLPKDMEVDGSVSATQAKKLRKNKDKSQSRKQLRRKPQNKVTFPSSRGKGALKPYNGSRVGKKRA
ncbi:hypothetical protein NX059_002274 [Plenodomus lindquistii]|nr:hypothetical protein NX059_002274 [Plenodomus lindquistii]